MKNKSFIFGVGILGLGTVFAYTLVSQVSATSISLTSTTEPIHFQIRELTEEEKAEMLTKHQERLAEQLSNGTITQQQYDEMITAMENGDIPMIKGNRNHFAMERIELTDEQKAEILTKQQERLTQELADGTITQEQYDEIVEKLENGEMIHFRNHPDAEFKIRELTEEEKTERIEQMKSRLEQEFSDGKITQEQYNEMISSLENGEFPMVMGKEHRGPKGDKTISFTLSSEAD